MGALKIWDLEQLSPIILGVPIEGGYGEGEVVKIEHDEPAFTMKKGADGHVNRSKTYNGVAKITLTLMQTSEYNALLSAILNVDKAGKNGAGVGPTQIRDKSGATLYFASKSWIEGPPNATFSREATHRDWVICTADLTHFEGGN
jgi:hypothetical protein